MNETNYEIALQLIMSAGDAKADSMSAIKAARAGDFEAAADLLQKAEGKMRDAHQLQINLIQQEAGGQPVEVNIILVHAQDHLTMAMTAQDMAEEMIQLYQMIHKEKETV